MDTNWSLMSDCYRCGAVVPDWNVDKHMEWHTDMDNLAINPVDRPAFEAWCKENDERMQDA